MKSELKRIEAALQQADRQKTEIAVDATDFPDREKIAPGQICQQAMANPTVAKSLLKDFQRVVGQWTQSIQEVTQQIQALYEEGPIVDGWLESSSPKEYQLCGLNQDGQLWYRSCPAEQVPDISLAIVRYQRLQQLLASKQALEQRLIHLTEGLLGAHQQMTEFNPQ